jgi:itaconate CoA-transferase
LVGVLEALYEREKTGQGKSIKSTLFGGMADWMTVPLLHQEYGGKAPGRGGLSHPSIAPYEAYETKEGGPIVISIQNQTEWKNLCSQALQKPELFDDPRFDTNENRVKNRAELNQEVGGVFAAHTRNEMTMRLSEARIAFGSLNSVADLTSHPQIERMSVDSPTGPVNLVASPVQFAGNSPTYKPIPALGEHSKKIRDEFSE